MKNYAKILASVLVAGLLSTPTVANATSNAGQGSTGGKVVVYAPSPTGLNDKINEAFTKKTGIAVESFSGTTGEILAKLEAEKANPVADVVIMASWPEGMSLQKEDQLLSYEPKNSDKLVKSFVDEKKTLFGYSASALGVIYNTSLIPTLDKDWAELGGEEFKDQIAIPDPTKSGSCKDFLTGYVNVVGDKAYDDFKALFANGMTIPGANKAALEAVITGEKAILIAGVDYNAYSSIKKGEPLAIYYPKSGTVVNPRPAMILKTSKNVENAKLYMDFLLSDEVQDLVGKAFLLPGIEDFKIDTRPSMKEVPQLKIDWAWMIENSKDVTDKFMKLNENKGQ